MSDTPVLSTAASSSVVSPGTVATPTAEPTNDANTTVVVDELDPLLGSASEPAKKEADLIDVGPFGWKLGRPAVAGSGIERGLIPLSYPCSSILFR
jgi:hypothetical protein